ncbi:unnamed protein product [Soboliphyme baturini]|uniref:MFS domain-containing protein n=1 Tax=Soboliphyme baturini TaxID=241478 RepID=A0A183IY59_9BILA|nr:unnamed protein product [Soboliphyme baturini]
MEGDPGLADDGAGQSQHVWTFWLVISVLAATLGSSFVFGYNVGVLNSPEIVMTQWLNSTLQHGENSNTTMTKTEISTGWAIIVSLFPLGALCGGVVSGCIVEVLGR